MIASSRSRFCPAPADGGPIEGGGPAAYGGDTMTTRFRFDPTTLPPECEVLRREVRAFLAEELASGNWLPCSDFGARYDAEFSRRLGAKGWIGMTWPRRYGGGERTALERYVVVEELLVAGAPVTAH